MAPNLENLDKLLAEFDRYADAANDPRHKAMIHNYRDHNRFEQTGDVEGLMSLITDDAEWHVFGSVVGGGEVHIKGRDDIRQRYEKMEDFIGSTDASGSHLEHMMVTDWGLAGMMRGITVMPGRVAAGTGHAVQDENANYLYTCQLAFFRAFSGDRTSAMYYFPSAPTIERLT